MPTDPLQPLDKDPDSWQNRLIGEVLTAYARREFETTCPARDVVLAKGVPPALARRMRRLIVKAGKEFARHVISSSQTAAVAANRKLESSRKKNEETMTELSSVMATVRLAENAVARLTVIESRLESARQEARANAARAESAETQCERLRQLLAARSPQDPGRLEALIRAAYVGVVPSLGVREDATPEKLIQEILDQAVAYRQKINLLENMKGSP